jgi:hypothetical protein
MRGLPEAESDATQFALAVGSGQIGGDEVEIGAAGADDAPWGSLRTLRTLRTSTGRIPIRPI